MLVFTRFLLVFMNPSHLERLELDGLTKNNAVEGLLKRLNFRYAYIVWFWVFSPKFRVISLWKTPLRFLVLSFESMFLSLFFTGHHSPSFVLFRSMSKLRTENPKTELLFLRVLLKDTLLLFQVLRKLTLNTKPLKGLTQIFRRYVFVDETLLFRLISVPPQ